MRHLKMIDLTQLESLSGGDVAFERDMLESFQRTLGSDWPALVQALSQAEHLRVKDLAHKHKSGARALGLAKMYEILHKLENWADTQSADDTAPQLVELQEIWEATLNEIKEILR